MKNITKIIVILALVLCVRGNAQVYQWTQSVTGAEIRSEAVTTDLEGNVFTTGEVYFSTVDFDPGPGTYNITVPIGRGAFIQKLDTDGNFMWAKALYGEAVPGAGGTVAIGEYIKTDAFGNVYVLGWFNETIDFDPGPATYNLTGYGTTFLLKLDADGNFQWVDVIEDGLYNFENGLEIGLDGIYVLGQFDDNIDFDPGPASFFVAPTVTELSENTYLLKLDFDGGFSWVKTFEAMGESDADILHVDQDDNVYFSGTSYDGIDIDPGPAVHLIEGTEYTSFVLKLNSMGEYIWSNSMWGHTALAITTNAAGDLYLGGRFFTTTDFDPGVGEAIYTPGAGYNHFVEKMDSDGHFIWVNSNENSAVTKLESIIVDPENHVYAMGNFSGTIDIAAGVEVFELAAVGGQDVFIQHLDDNGIFLSAVNVGGTDVDAGSSMVYSALGFIVYTGLYKGSVDFDFGPGTDVKTGLTSAFNHFVGKFYPSNVCDGETYADTLNVISCDPYLWDENGETYVTTGLHRITHSSIEGCDSVIALNYLRPVDDILLPEVTACNEYWWEASGTTYTESGSYTVILTNDFGCDSSLTFDLVIIANDMTISREGLELEVNTYVAESYQWVDCADDFNWIDGEINRKFTPYEDGSYAVIVTKNGCTDTSDCYSVNYMGLENELGFSVQVYPNPITDLATVYFGQEMMGEYSLVIYDVLGQVVYECDKVTGNSIEIKKEDLGLGVFMISLIDNSTGQNVYQTKLMTQ